MAVIDRPFGRIAAATERSRELIGRLPRPVLLYLLAVTIPVGFLAGPLFLTLLRVLLLILIVPLSIRLLTGGYGRIIITDILFFLHVGWMTVAMAVNNPDLVVQNTGSTAVEFLGGYLVGRACVRSRADFIALCRALGIAICLSLPLALAESQTGVPYLIKLLDALPGIQSETDVNIAARMGLQRAQVMMTHPIHYGLFASSAFSLAVLGLKDVLTTPARLAMGGAILLCVFLSLSSGALLPTFVQLGLIVWAAMFRGKGRPWLVLGLLFLLAYVAIDLLSNRTPMRVFMSYATFSAHNAYWRGIIFDWGMMSVWKHPLYGIGLNDWVRPTFMHSGSMDNFWLVMAVRYGIPGFLLIAVGYGWSFLRIMRRDFGTDVVLNRLRRGWVFTFVGLTLTLCTVHVWTTMYSFVFFLFGAGMWLTQVQPASGTAAPKGLPPRGLPARQVPGASDAPVSGTDDTGSTDADRARGAPPFSRFPPVTARGG